MSKPHLFKTAAAVLLALCLPVAQAAPDNSPDNGRQLAAGLAAYMKRPLQNSFFPDSQNLIKDFRLFLFQISTDSTQIPPP